LPKGRPLINRKKAPPATQGATEANRRILQEELKMYHIHEVDIVIIGGGAAGAMAAIYANRTNPTLKVAVLDKSKIETSGAAGRGMDALNTMALPPYSYPEDVVEHLTKVTEGVLDQEVAQVYGLRCPQVVRDLEEIMQREKGDLFPVDENGNYRLFYLHPIQ
jgi:succinate dehydrogenase/fumarate reductase flavoprotein subunit